MSRRGPQSRPPGDERPHPPATGLWRLRVDTGGTFTDCLAFDPAGKRHELKVLSSSALRSGVTEVAGGRIHLDADWDLPEDFFRGYRARALGGERGAEVLESKDGGRELTLEEALDPDELRGSGLELLSPEEAPLLAARMATRTPLCHPLPPIELRLGTTRGTNALLERAGARTALLVSEGFGDLLEIGTQQRPELFALEVRRPEPLPSLVLEIEGRLDAGGRVLAPIDEERLEAVIARLRDEGIEAIAIALLHSYRNPTHEELVEERLRRAGFEHSSRSSAVAPFQQLLARAQTSVVDAYLSPIIDRYLGSIGDSLRNDRGRLHVMTSAGGLVSRAEYRPKDSLLSGPAGGVVGAAASGRAAGHSKLLSLDMGGTSTDVARIDGDFEYVFEHEVGDAHLLTPALAIETVAAGGGSICSVEHGRLVVGPHSAGAFPGSACYGAGGPLTLTDVNLLLGRIRPERLPIPIDRAAAERRLEEQVEALREQTGEITEPLQLLEGWLRIADERMAEAIRRISLRKGHDPAEHALLAFGGAGGQHACAIAEMLGIRTVLSPPSAGILSAVGLHHARLERFVERQLLAPLEELEPKLESLLTEMTLQACELVAREGIPAEAIEVERRILEMRCAGQDSTLTLEHRPEASPRQLFERRYEELFSHRPPSDSIELVSVRVVARAGEESAATRDGSYAEKPRPGDLSAADPPSKDARAGGGPEIPRVRALSRSGWTEMPCLERRGLLPGEHLRGPALIVEDHALFFLEAGWTLRVHGDGCLIAVSEGTDDLDRHDAAAPAAVRLELFRHRFQSIAQEMGEQLRRTAISTNIKERLDFSCALLDSQGRLVVNAPHIPVHLGALGLCVRTLREAVSLGPGDMVLTNHPAFGGSHLPDLTLVSAAHDERGTRIGYLAVRAHHAEIGGITPGSMPPDAHSLAEEGVVLPPLYLVRGGILDTGEIERRLSEDLNPSRAIADNLADLRAMAAAVRVGLERLGALASTHGVTVLAAQMDALRALASRHVEASLQALPEARYTAVDRMDDGSQIHVAVEIQQRCARIDFSGSAPVHPGNLNATEAIVRSAVLYFLRLLVREALPLNEGLMESIDLVLPEGMLNPSFSDDPQRCPAIVGGNVETSQRVVDVLLKALGLVAASQGTMNNLSFGNAGFGYYETLGGGTGAGEGFDGASGVHSHMTNTRLTDAEVLEHRYPVRVRRLALRRGSGGTGRWRGGDGILRELEFLEPVTLSVLTQRRTLAPYGLRGGGPASMGSQFVLRVDGERVPLASLDRYELAAGDRFVIETPGGGGFGEVMARDPGVGFDR